MRQFLRESCLVGALLMAAPTAIGADGGNRIELKKLMTAEQYTQAGLAKLSAAELVALEAWLATYTEAVAQVSRAIQPKVQAPPAMPPKPLVVASPDVIETCIEGEFEGWEGETVFQLCNGQIWQQSEYAYMYEYAYRPDVVIYRTSSGYRMKVEDVSETISVLRIK